MNYFRKRRNAFQYAFSGLRYLLKNEAHARIHLLAALLVVALGFYFDVDIFEWLALLLSIGMVLGMEAINSAVELLTDMVAPEFSERAGKVKDMAAAAVLVVALAAAGVGALVFIPKIITLFF